MCTISPTMSMLLASSTKTIVGKGICREGEEGLHPEPGALPSGATKDDFEELSFFEADKSLRLSLLLCWLTAATLDLVFCILLHFVEMVSGLWLCSRALILPSLSYREYCAWAIHILCHCARLGSWKRFGRLPEFYCINKFWIETRALKSAKILTT